MPDASRHESKSRQRDKSSTFRHTHQLMRPLDPHRIKLIERHVPLVLTDKPKLDDSSDCPDRTIDQCANIAIYWKCIPSPGNVTFIRALPRRGERSRFADHFQGFFCSAGNFCAMVQGAPTFKIVAPVCPDAPWFGLHGELAAVMVAAILPMNGQFRNVRREYGRIISPVHANRGHSPVPRHRIVWRFAARCPWPALRNAETGAVLIPATESISPWH